MKKIWESIKAIFAIRKLIKNFNEMNLEAIRKIWVLIGSIIASLSLNLPPFIADLFQVEGTELIFTLLGSAITVYQFVSQRVGEQEVQDPQVQQLKNVKFSGGVMYLINPFASGPKKA